MYKTNNGMATMRDSDNKNLNLCIDILHLLSQFSAGLSRLVTALGGCYSHRDRFQSARPAVLPESSTLAPRGTPDCDTELGH